MLPTPTTSGLDFDKVYEPAEDSFLLLDVLEQEAQVLRSCFSYPLVVEIGTGSGIVTTFVQNSIFNHNGLFLTTDINIHACRSSLQTSQRNGGTMYIDSLRCSLTSGLRPGLIDVLIFNPPYVPDSEPVPVPPCDDDDTRWLDLALVGGKDGMQVTNELLNHLDTILSHQGIAYILFCKRNKPEQVASAMRSKDWVVEFIEERTAGWEVLSVWKFSKKKQQKQLKTQ